MRRTLFVAVLSTLASSVFVADARAGGCEDAVIAECIKTTCPAFCATLDGDQVAACKAGCTATDRCKLELFGGQDRPDEVELDVEKREQLMACLAENRAAIHVSDDLGKPMVKDTAYVEPTDQSIDAVPHHSLRDQKVSKSTWKKRKARSFAERHKGSHRLDPLHGAPPAEPPPVKSPPTAPTTPPAPGKPSKPRPGKPPKASAIAPECPPTAAASAP